MSRPQRALLLWLVVGAAGLFIVPWYALPDTVLGIAWLRDWSGKESAPAILQILRYGTPWLVPLVLLLGAGAVLLPPKLHRRTRASGLIVVGSAGAIYALLQGFAIGPSGWSLPEFGALFGALAGRQYGMGFGACLTLTAFTMILSLGLAGRGYFKGDAFVAGSVVAVGALVAVFTFFPVAKILLQALENNDGAFSVPAFLARFTTEKIWGIGCILGATRCGVAWNTLLLALLCATGCSVLGLAFALIVTRTRFRYKKLLRVLSVLPIITPPFVIGLGLILLFGRSGLVNHFLEWAFGITPTRWIYGMQGILVAQIFAFTPIAFLVLIGVVEGVSPALEEAAQTLRAGRWRTLLDVSLPLMRPGLANAFLISFIESIADFGNPILLGGNFGVLSTEIFFSVVGAQLDQGRAATLGIVLLLFALGAFFAQRWVLGTTVYTAMSGKGDSGLPIGLPDGVAALVLWHRVAVGAADCRDLRDGARRRFRRDLGPRLHAYAQALREGLRHRVGTVRAHLGRRRVEFVLDDSEALGHRSAADGGAWHPDRVPADAAEIRRAGGVRIRDHAVVRRFPAR